MKFVLKRFAALFLSLAVLIGVMPVSSVMAADSTEDEAFETWMSGVFAEMMESDYLTMHFTVRYPENYGIEKTDDVTFGTADLDSYTEAEADAEKTLTELEEFDYDKLSLSHQRDYDTIEKYFKDIKVLNEYPMMDSCFNPNTGILDNIITNMTEFVFYTEEDFDDYLSVLSSIDDYLADAVELTKTQASEGYFLSDSLLDEAEEWIADFAAKTDDSALIVIFDENIDAFEGLDDSTKEAYKEKNKEIVLNEVIPAYENVSTELEKLRGSAKYEGGTANYPNGKDYYLALAQTKTSTSMTIEEMMDLCENYMDGIMQMLYVVQISGSFSSVDENETVDMETPDEILTYLQNHLDSYPEGPSVKFKSSYLDPSVANDAIVAYYMEPPVDDIEDNVIRINGDNVSDVNSMYETLAHEGFPGHLYQITYYLNTNPNPVRTQVGELGYTEGWAMYAEFNAWLDAGVSQYTAMSNMIDTGLGYVLDAYADLAVNGLGWTVDELSEWLTNYGLNGEAAQSLYDFVIERPGMILPYGVGLAYFTYLRAMAEAALGDDFDEVEFNEVLLTYGDRPFETVKEDVYAYLESKGVEVPEEGSYGYLDPYLYKTISNGISSIFGNNNSGKSSGNSSNNNNNNNTTTPSPFSGNSAAPFNNEEDQQEEMVGETQAQPDSTPYVIGICGVLGVIALFAVFRIRAHAKGNPFTR